VALERLCESIQEAGDAELEPLVVAPAVGDADAADA
jgi:hypothetical protein